MADTKAQKIARIASGTITQQPLPEVPRLPQSFYDRHPEDKEALDKFHDDWVEFFKKVGTRTQ